MRMNSRAKEIKYDCRFFLTFVSYQNIERNTSSKLSSPLPENFFNPHRQQDGLIFQRNIEKKFRAIVTRLESEQRKKKWWKRTRVIPSSNFFLFLSRVKRLFPPKSRRSGKKCRLPPSFSNSFESSTTFTLHFIREIVINLKRRICLPRSEKIFPQIL